MIDKVKKIIKSVAKNWEYETEYCGKMESYCFYCGKYQDSIVEKHKPNCISLLARELLIKK